MNLLVNFKRRFFESIIIIAIVLLLIIFSQNIFTMALILVLVSFLAGVGAFEYFKMLELKNIIISKYLFITTVVLGVISFFIASQFHAYRTLPASLVFVFIFLYFIFQFKNAEGAIVKIASSTFGFIYIAVPLGLMLSILYINRIDGRVWLMYLLLVTKITDIGGYLGGSIFGKRKLAINISPNKTKEGFIAGLFLAVLSSIVYAFLFKSGLRITFLEALFLGLMLGIIGQIGDLCESLLKRDAKIKDSNMLPGLGGVLDMLDSLIFNIPIVYFFLQIRSF
jgi:phosphatidate cytidylyltransferase